MNELLIEIIRYIYAVSVLITLSRTLWMMIIEADGVYDNIKLAIIGTLVPILNTFFALAIIHWFIMYLINGAFIRVCKKIYNYFCKSY